MFEDKHRANMLLQIEQYETAVAEIMSAWRAIPQLPSSTEIERALSVQPCAREEPTKPPDWTLEETTFAEAIAACAAQMHPRGALSRCAALIATACSFALAPLLGPAVILVGLVAAFVAHYVAKARWQARLRAVAEQQVAAEWPRARTALLERYAQKQVAYDVRVSETSKAWIGLETQRIDELKLVIGGQLDAIERALSAAVHAFNFPFETECAFAVDEEDHALMDIDLPEIEDVVSETRPTLLKNGTVKEVRRKAVERNAAYAELVSGLAFTFAGMAFAVAPTLQFVTVAGHTQRKNRDCLDPVDTYVYEVRFPRAAFTHLVSGFDPVAALRALPSRFEVSANGAMRKLPEPKWAGDLWSGNVG